MDLNLRCFRHKDKVGYDTFSGHSLGSRILSIYSLRISSFSCSSARRACRRMDGLTPVGLGGTTIVISCCKSGESLKGKDMAIGTWVEEEGFECSELVSSICVDSYISISLSSVSYNSLRYDVLEILCLVHLRALEPGKIRMEEKGCRWAAGGRDDRFWECEEEEKAIFCKKKEKKME